VAAIGAIGKAQLGDSCDRGQIHELHTKRRADWSMALYWTDDMGIAVSPMMLVGKQYARNSRALRNQPLLNLFVASGRVRSTPLVVIEVLPADHRLGIVARRQAHLRLRACIEIVRRPRAAHLGRDPSGLDCIR